MENQLKFVEILFEKLINDTKKHIKIKKESGGGYWTKNYMNREHGKVALKRKITLLRQELLNLEKMLDV